MPIVKSLWPNRPSLEEIRSPGFATPWDAPLVPPFPFGFRNAEILTLSYRSSAEAIAKLIPPPLEPSADVVLVHIYRMHDTDWLGTYSESNVMVGARLPGRGVEGGYSPYLFLDSDAGVAHGREVHGQPKKFARPSLERQQDLLVGRIERNGIDVLTATLPYKQARAEPTEMTQHFDFRTNLNLKAIDHIDGRPAIRQLTSRRLSDVRILECWSGPCTVELRPNAQAPLYRLPVVEMLTGWYWRADFTLVAGEIVFDYLNEGSDAHE